MNPVVGMAGPVCFAIDGVTLHCDLTLPPAASGLVVFVHGSGSNRLSPRNRQVARRFHGRGLGTVVFDLLGEEEQRIDDLTREFRFDIPLLAARLVQVIDDLVAMPEVASQRIGLFGASTGAAAALIAAARRPLAVRAVVSRGGRVDLADDVLPQVRAPTLMIVGGEDDEVLALNRACSRKLACVQQLAVVPGATHLFEEPGALAQVETLAADWFCRHLQHCPGP